MRKVLVRPQARLDLLEIWHSIAPRSATAADQVIVELERAIRRLAEMPGIGHVRREVKDSRLRFWSVYRYVIGYRYDDQTLVVVRIVHGHRDFRKQFRRT